MSEINNSRHIITELIKKIIDENNEKIDTNEFKFDICNYYYGKLYLLRRYNITLLNNKYKNKERDEFIPNVELMENLISANNI